MLIGRTCRESGLAEDRGEDKEREFSQGRGKWTLSPGGGVNIDQKQENHNTFHFHLGPGWVIHGLPEVDRKKKIPFLSKGFILREMEG